MVPSGDTMTPEPKPSCTLGALSPAPGKMPPKKSRNRGSLKNGCCCGARARLAARIVTTAGPARSTTSAYDPGAAAGGGRSAEAVFFSSATGGVAAGAGALASCFSQADKKQASRLISNAGFIDFSKLLRGTASLFQSCSRLSLASANRAAAIVSAANAKLVLCLVSRNCQLEERERASKSPCAP